MSASSEGPSPREMVTPEDRDGLRTDPSVESSALSAGRVGRAHGLDGSFYVTAPKPRLLALGATVKLDGRVAEIVRRAGTDQHPLIRLRGVEDRGAADALRGMDLAVEVAEAPELGEGEWWAGELEGCAVFDGERRVGTVLRLVELPSCEALEVSLDLSSRGEGAGGASEMEGPVPRAGGPSEPEGLVPGMGGASEPEGPVRKPGGASELLVPMVRDAIRGVDPVARRIDVDMSFLEELL